MNKIKLIIKDELNRSKLDLVYMLCSLYNVPYVNLYIFLEF